MRKTEIKQGTKFGRLVVIKEVESQITAGGTTLRFLECRCECGTIKNFRLTHLKKGVSKSCGCFRKERAKGIIGEEHNRWKGGSNLKMKIRASNQYKEWRTKCFERDNYTCQISGQKGGKLNVHHLIPFYIMIDDLVGDFRYNEELWDLDNGITISEKIHKQFHKKYGVENFTKQNFLDFKKVIVGSTGL